MQTRAEVFWSARSSNEGGGDDMSRVQALKESDKSLGEKLVIGKSVGLIRHAHLGDIARKIG